MYLIFNQGPFTKLGDTPKVLYEDFLPPKILILNFYTLIKEAFLKNKRSKNFQHFGNQRANTYVIDSLEK